MKKMILTLLISIITTTISAKEFTMAIQPTFGAHQHIGYEIIERLEARGITVNTVPTKSSIKGNSLLMNKQIDVNVGSITSFIVLNDKMPEQSLLLSAIGHYKYFLQCTPDIKTMDDVKTTKIVTSGRNTLEHHTIRWLAKEHFGDPYALDENFITMKRPQIWQILQAGSSDVKCVMTGAPLQNKIQDELGFVTVATSDVEKGIAGSYNAYWTRKDWVDQNPSLAYAFITTAVEVIRDYNKDPITILEKFIQKDKMDTTAEYLQKGHIKNQAIFHSDLRGSEYFNNFLYEIEYLKDNKGDISKMIYRAEALK
jgi:ABC-type nitrate/sulfonate/bicarbonate transport system substrate-binding protein